MLRQPSLLACTCKEVVVSAAWQMALVAALLPSLLLRISALMRCVQVLPLSHALIRLLCFSEAWLSLLMNAQLGCKSLLLNTPCMKAS